MLLSILNLNLCQFNEFIIKCKICGYKTYSFSERLDLLLRILIIKARNFNMCLK